MSVNYLLYARLSFGLGDPAGDKVDRTPAPGELMFPGGSQKTVRKQAGGAVSARSKHWRKILPFESGWGGGSEASEDVRFQA